MDKNNENSELVCSFCGKSEDMRSVRRHHKKRVKTNAIRNNKYGRTKEDYQDAKLLGRNTSCSKVCSCYMCGNQRRHAKGKNRLTIQERKILQNKASLVLEYAG